MPHSDRTAAPKAAEDLPAYHEASAPARRSPHSRQSSSPALRSPPPRWALLVAFAIVYLVWGSTYLAIRVAVDCIPPFSMAGMRFLLAGGGLLTYAWLRGLPSPTWRQCYHAGVVGVLLFVGGNGLVCWSEQTVPSGLTALIIAASPLWMVFLGTCFFGHAQPRGWVLAGLVLGMLGVGILLRPDPASAQEGSFLGILGLLLACGSWALGSLRSQNAELPQSSIVSSAVEMVIGGMVLIPLGCLVGEWGRFDPQSITPEAIGSFVYLVVFGSMITLSAYTWLLQVCDAATVSTYAYVNPVVAVVLGTWLGGEKFNLSMAVGACLILISVIFVTLPRWRKKSLDNEAAADAQTCLNSEEMDHEPLSTLVQSQEHASRS